MISLTVNNYIINTIIISRQTLRMNLNNVLDLFDHNRIFKYSTREAVKVECKHNGIVNCTLARTQSAVAAERDVTCING